MQRPAISKTLIQQTEQRERKNMILQSELVNYEFYCGICKVIFTPVAREKKNNSNNAQMFRVFDTLAKINKRTNDNTQKWEMN